MTSPGDVANCFALFTTAVFFVAVAANEMGYANGIFSPVWSKDGFCVTNKDNGQPLLNSHSFCFYGDTIATIILWWIIKYDRQKGETSERVLGVLEPGVGGVFMHGLAHLAMGLMPELTTQSQQQVSLGNVHEWLPLAGGLMLFWFCLLRSINKHIADKKWFGIAFLFTIGQVLFVAPKFGFTYVHVGLMTTATAVALNRADKDRCYDLEGWLINFPITLMAWLEACTCESFLVHVGGHFWYDIEIPLAMFAFWWIARGFKTDVTTKKIS